MLATTLMIASLVSAIEPEDDFRVVKEQIRIIKFDPNSTLWFHITLNVKNSDINGGEWEIHDIRKSLLIEGKPVKAKEAIEWLAKDHGDKKVMVELEIYNQKAFVPVKKASFYLK